MRPALALLLTMLPGLAGAVTLDLPANANLEADVTETPGIYDMPIGPWREDGMPILSEEGTLHQQAWRIDGAGLTTAQILLPLRAQLTEAGFDILFECQTEGCGGFDFRFATRVMNAPDMHVDLGDFRYLAAERDNDRGTELVSLLISRSAQAGHVQLTRVGPPTDTRDMASATGAALSSTAATPQEGLVAELERTGRAVLSDLTFETGSAQLGSGTFASLETLSDYLAANPERRVALVGHTDSVGALEGNIALSRRRAGSILERLVSDYAVPRRQLEAEGMGYLAPIASNLTDAGREANRRVEVIMLSTE
ncbi:OmpA family protein [Salibaculum griseiflavum]|uniref:OmpA family protein n=1 Tax=Salibaculum griseiflavum TaxID=1914409 RepID=A0A2V1P9M8_9RHOB|nr:OmpA family protein [Salibaculum griseiflavum]PWG18464.1 OmpA family protein [Salibaculum griseiflavum]